MIIWSLIISIARVQELSHSLFLSSLDPPWQNIVDRHLKNRNRWDRRNGYLHWWCRVWAAIFIPGDRWNGHRSIFLEEKIINGQYQPNSKWRELFFKVVTSPDFSRTHTRNVGAVGYTVQSHTCAHTHRHAQSAHVQDVAYIKSSYTLTK